MSIEAGQSLSHYRLIEKIGEGGMGVVWKAEDTVLGRTVAIKLLPADVSRDAERREMFLQEARLASSVGAAHVAQVHEFGREGDLDFIVMEYVEGQSLSKLLHGRPLPPHKVTEFGYQLAHALSKAHRKKLLHRDLKPANVIVTPDGEVKVLDFGLATLFQPADGASRSQATTRLAGEEPQAVGLAGTLPYMSPEQARMEALDARSDIFSLGTMLYEMTTGQLPFTGPTSTDVLRAVQQARPQPVHELLPQVPLELDRIIRKAMAPRREDRYHDVQDLAVDLRRLGKDLESGSSPSYADLSRVESSRPKKPSRWIAAGSAVAVILGLMGFLAYRQLGPPSEPAGPSTGARIVVLPFDNLGSPNDQYFADGMTEEITSRLQAVSGLGVISRTSAARYAGTDKSLQQIGEELDVGFVLEGTVRWDPGSEGRGRIRITPRLIRVRDDTNLWAEVYDRKLEDVFAVQSEIAGQVADALGIALQVTEQTTIEARPTDNLEAYNAYLRGINLGYPIYSRDLDLARQMFERAVELDPGFGLAYAELARVLAWYQHVDSRAANPARAEEAIREALRLAPDSPVVQCHAGHYYYWGVRDYPRAIEHFRRAIELRPTYSYAYQGLAGALGGRGEYDAAVATKLKALELDPQFDANYGDVGDYLMFGRRYAEADENYRRAMELAPDRTVYYDQRLQNYLLWDGKTARAELLLESWPGGPPATVRARLAALNRDWQAALELRSPLSEDSSWDQCYYLLGARQAEAARAACESARRLLEEQIEDRPGTARLHSALGLIYARLGRKADAIREGRRAVELRPLRDHATNNTRYLLDLARIYATVGEQDAAIEELDHLLSIPSPLSVPMLRLDPIWDPLRDDPAFSELLAKYEPDHGTD